MTLTFQLYLGKNGLTVTETIVPRRTAVLSGTVAAMNKAFGIELKKYGMEQESTVVAQVRFIFRRSCD